MKGQALSPRLDTARLRRDVERVWQAEILPTLHEYVRIPNQSPQFDPGWEQAGHMERATQLVADWLSAHALPGMTVSIERLPGRTPVVLAELPATGPHAPPGTVLLYGHLDKQPPMSGWLPGLDPWTPVLRDGKLYGRGAADDGYAAFASLAALAALAAQDQPRARCVLLIEASEESGSVDLPAHVAALGARLGEPDLVVCLDSGCGNYEQLWNTTSLRGLVSGRLSVDVLSEGVHSGDAGGIVPESFRVLRELLGRIEDGPSGRILPEALHARIPEQRRQQARHAAEVLGGAVSGKFPFAPGVRPLLADGTELILNRTWRPSLAVTGAAGLPPLENAGNVLRPRTELQLSLRLPPSCDAAAALELLARELLRDPPHGAQVRFIPDTPCNGWNAPPGAPWLEQALQAASNAFFGKPACALGEGGSIPFIGMLGARFPQARFLVTGVLGPHSNAHGPNEFLHLATAERLTCCVAAVIAAHAQRGADVAGSPAGA